MGDITLKAKFWSVGVGKLSSHTDEDIFDTLTENIKDNIWKKISYTDDTIWDIIWVNINSKDFIKKSVKKNILKAIKDEKYRS